jgi:hypothetical protein
MHVPRTVKVYAYCLRSGKEVFGDFVLVCFAGKTGGVCFAGKTGGCVLPAKQGVSDFCPLFCSCYRMAREDAEAIKKLVKHVNSVEKRHADVERDNRKERFKLWHGPDGLVPLVHKLFERHGVRERNDQVTLENEDGEIVEYSRCTIFERAINKKKPYFPMNYRTFWGYERIHKYRHLIEKEWPQYEDGTLGHRETLCAVTAAKAQVRAAVG